MHMALRPRLGWVLTLALTPPACSAEAMKILLEATETASAVFKEAKDEARVKRDAAASERLGELSVGPNRLTVEELQPLKGIVVSAKADGKVTRRQRGLCDAAHRFCGGADTQRTEPSRYGSRAIRASACNDALGSRTVALDRDGRPPESLPAVCLVARERWQNSVVFLR
jgi:hypothetical protein